VKTPATFSKAKAASAASVDWDLRLYVAGPTPKSVAAFRNLEQICEEHLAGIRTGDVDAVLVQGPRGDQLFTLKGADEPYRVLIEEMNQGAVTLSADGSILSSFCRSAEDAP
jgi:hypothetical protein